MSRELQEDRCGTRALEPPELPPYLELHSCNHCADLVLNIPGIYSLGDQTSISGSGNDNTIWGDLGFTLEEAWGAAKSGCSFFNYIINHQVVPAEVLEQRSRRRSRQDIYRFRYHLASQTIHDRGPSLFKIYSYPTSDPKSILRGPPNLDVTSDLTFQRARSWISDCVKNHSNCSRRSPMKHPGRLIDVAPNGDTLASFVRLEEKAPLAHQYAALSYCWGKNQLMTTKATVSDFRMRIPLTLVSKTVQDAITVTRRLGMRYLWVDCLCIVQDNDEDKATEIGKMADTYQCAQVTIVAASAEDSRQGFLGPRNGIMTYKLALRTNGEALQRILLATYGDDMRYKPSFEPINKRAWCMQEIVLSPRVLFFSSYQVFWDCYQLCDSDGGTVSEQPTGIVHSNSLLASMSTATTHNAELDKAKVLDEWAALVSSYSGRQLSISTDKFSAIGGVADKFGRILKDAYMAGLWKRTLPATLYWHRQSGSMPRPTAYRAPSWLWASVDSDVRIPNGPEVLRLLRSSMIDVLEATVVPLYAEAPYGQILSAFLRIRGPMLQVRWHYLELYNKHFIVGLDRKFGTFERLINFTLDAWEERCEEDNLWLLMIFSTHHIEHMSVTGGLIVKEHKETRALSRIGNFSFGASLFHQDAQAWIQAFETREITIV